MLMMLFAVFVSGVAFWQTGQLGPSAVVLLWPAVSTLFSRSLLVWVRATTRALLCKQGNARPPEVNGPGLKLMQCLYSAHQILALQPAPRYIL